MSLKCLQISAWINGVLTIIFIALGISMPFIFNSLLHSQIKDQVIMTKDNQNMWAEIPGETNSLVIRNYTFFNFTNPWDVFFRNATPIFVELGPYTFQEITSLQNPTFSENGELIDFYLWRYYPPINGTTGLEQVSVLNFGPQGVWYQLKQANESMIAIQAFSTMIMGLSDMIRFNILSFGANSQCITQAGAQQLFAAAKINAAQADALWNDTQFGWKNISTLNMWMDFGLNGQYSGAGKILADYFKLNYQQMSILYQGLFYKCVAAVNSSAIQNHYCNQMNPGFACDDRLLATMQIVDQEITMQTPPPIKPFESLTTINFTAIGYPEISYWYNSYFLNNSPVANQYVNVSFPVSWGMQIFDFNRDPKQFVKQSFNIMNSGNMDYLWYNGKFYDQNTTTNAQNLTNIQNRFLLNDTKQAFVFWQYMKYFVYNFTLQNPNLGNQAMAGLGQFISEKLYDGWVQVYNNLLPIIEGQLILRNISLNSVDCSNYFMNTIAGLNQLQAFTACQLSALQPWNVNSMIFLNEICTSQNDIEFKIFYNQSTWNNSQIMQLCSPDGGSYFSVRHFYGQFLHDHYNCSNLNIYCSKYEITVKQWANSTITLFPPTQLLQFYQPAYSTKKWFPDITPIPWEFFSFAVEFRDLWTKPIQQLSWASAYDLLTFQNIFSQTMVQRVFIYEKNNNQQGIFETFYFSDMKQLTYYLRYIMIGYSFGGFVQNRTINELLFGYIDPVIEKLKVKDPQQGGNPSLASCVMLNEANTTAPNSNVKTCGRIIFNYLNFSQEMYSGQGSSLQKLRYYNTIWNKNYITYNFSWFDGINVHQDTVTPWAANVNLTGTDSTMNPPFITDNTNLSLYVTTFYRGGQGHFDGSNKPVFNGLETWQYKIGEDFYQNMTLNPDNVVFYNYKYNGFINMTSIQQAPIFVSKTHLLDADSFLKDSVVYVDKFGQVIQANQWDDSWMNVEPNTGITIQAVVNAQANLLFEQDELFLINSTKMLPIFNTYRGGNWTDDKIDEYFGPLKTAFSWKIWLIVIPYSLGFITLVATLVLIYLFIKQKRKLQMPMEEEDPQLLAQNQQNVQ